VVKPRGEGDSRFRVFARATASVAAAAAMQRTLVTEAWPTPRPMAVRSREQRLFAMRDRAEAGAAVYGR